MCRYARGHRRPARRITPPRECLGGPGTRACHRQHYGNHRVQFRCIDPRATRGLQRAIGGGGWLGNALGGAVVDVDISGQIGNSSGAGSNPSQLCLFVTFHEEPAGSNAWIADFRLLRGGHMSVPLQVNVGTGTSAPAPANSPVATLGPVGIGAPTGARAGRYAAGRRRRCQFWTCAYPAHGFARGYLEQYPRSTARLACTANPRNRAARRSGAYAAVFPCHY